MIKSAMIVMLLTSPIWSKESVTLQLSWLHQFQFAGFYVAKEKGYYRDADLEVTIHDARSKINPLTAVMENKAQYAVGHTSLIVDSLKGKPIVLMAAMFQSSPMMLLVREDSGIKTAKDLRGKRIMLTSDVANGAEIQAMMRSVGIGTHDYIYQPHSYSASSLERNETDAMASYLSNEPFILEKKGVKTRAIHPKDYGFDFYSDILFSSQNEYTKHPERMGAFYNASMEGWRWAFDHIEETAEIIYHNYNPQHKSLESLIYEGKVLKELAFRPNVAFGTFDPVRLEMMAQGYRLMGIVNDLYSAEPIIYKNSEVHLSENEKKWLRNHPVIHIGIDKERPPVEFVDDMGKHYGISASYLKVLEKRLGIRFEVDYSYQHWSDARKAVENKKLDMLSCAAITRKDHSDILYSKPYMKQSMVIVANSKVGYVNDLYDLDGETIAVVRGNATEEILREHYSQLHLVVVDTPLEALQKVANGEVYGCVEGLNIVSYLIDRHDLKHLKVVGETPYQYEFGFGFRSDWGLLAVIADKVLVSVTAKEYEKIHGNWLVMEQKEPVDYKKIGMVASIVLFVFLLIAYKNRRLDTLVRQRTDELESFNLRLQNEVEKAVEKNRVQEKLLMQQAKMAEIGSMLESIAHQWRQPLNILGITMTQLNLSYGMDANSNAGKAIEIAETQIQYMSQTIDDFRNFFKQDRTLSLVNIDTLIADVENLLGPLLRRKKIIIEKEIDPTIAIMIYPNELKQVIINIVNNAREAIEQQHNELRMIRIRCDKEGLDYRISIEDTGGGIPPSIIDKIFDPYFTTKFESQGTGIGLYMAKMIIEKHFFGNLSVENTPYGANFIIRLKQNLHEIPFTDRGFAG
ncbi:MAG: ABC transporter substrate-binding protein [Sulfuricurvum sp.]|jgi:signal transduction histidine kinase/ABC-type nitrate/sulfonate/bicarbonate transport system substrate-binding protein|uniref:ABC transporter substrate-binding protein n=1 Tax=Sulfuricurvum sp. TaxID=2025608 RepID=UPI0025F2A57F|nr:ABC transporter substrate-binding protein [Sulfuricurvum sp.]MCK9371596.1 ABC transporter substrate-binding protein [Sulfuricurvum sp.]